MAIVKGLIRIIPAEQEREERYRERISSYLYDLLYREYKGLAHELTYPGEALAMGELKSLAQFMTHHTRFGWNLELPIDCQKERASIFSTECAEAFEVREWSPENDREPDPSSRPDYITWSRVDGRGNHRYLRVYLIKYFKFPECRPDFYVGEKSGVLLAEQCDEKTLANPDNVFNKIGRTTRSLCDLLARRKIPFECEFTVDNKPADLPKQREK